MPEVRLAMERIGTVRIVDVRVSIHHAIAIQELHNVVDKVHVRWLPEDDVPEVFHVKTSCEEEENTTISQSEHREEHKNQSHHVSTQPRRVDL